MKESLTKGQLSQRGSRENRRLFQGCPSQKTFLCSWRTLSIRNEQRTWKINLIVKITILLYHLNGSKVREDGEVGVWSRSLFRDIENNLGKLIGWIRPSVINVERSPRKIAITSFKTKRLFVALKQKKVYNLRKHAFFFIHRYYGLLY